MQSVSKFVFHQSLGVSKATKLGYSFPPTRIREVVEEINKWKEVQKVHETVFMLISLGPDKQVSLPSIYSQR